MGKDEKWEDLMRTFEFKTPYIQDIKHFNEY